MSEHCQDCMHWSRLIKFPEDTQPYSGVCLLAQDEHPSFRARSIDGFYARLETNSDFGCNQFEDKP